MELNGLHLDRRWVFYALIVYTLALAYLLLIQSPSIAQAQESTPTPTPTPTATPGACGSYQCVDINNFDSTEDGWEYRSFGSGSLAWMSSKTLGLFSTASGVVYVPRDAYGSACMIKSYSLSAGRYRIIAGAGSDFDFAGNSFSVNTRIRERMEIILPFSSLDAFSFSDKQSGTIEIVDSGPVDIQLCGTAGTYYDYVWLVTVDEAFPTSTPQATSPYPQPTVIPHTAVPTEHQSTPMPTPTMYCIDRPTGGITEYSPTSTPQADSFSYLETFRTGGTNYYSSGDMWGYLGSEAMDTSFLNHTNDGSSLSVILDYNTSEVLDSGLVFDRSFSDVFYVDLWVQADVIPQGQVAYIEFWGLNGTWEKIDQAQIGSGQWYPVHAEIDTEGTISALAFVASRSDFPAYGYVLADDIYIYSDLSNAPYCDGSYSSSVLDLSQPDDPNDHPVVWPADRPCPSDLDIPNNFWGPILAGVTQFMDSMFSFSPLHQAGIIADQARNLFVSPISAIFIFVSILFDWSWFLWGLATLIPINAVVWTIMAWKFLRRATVQ